MGRVSIACLPKFLIVGVTLLAACVRAGFDPYPHTDAEAAAIPYSGPVSADGARSDSDSDASIDVDSALDTLGNDATNNAATSAVLGCLQPVGQFANTLGGAGQAVTATPGLAYFGISEAAHGIQVVAMTGGGTPQLLGSFDTESGPAKLDASRNDVLGVTVSGDQVFLATYMGGVVALDVSDPSAPQFLGAIDLLSETWAVQRRGDYLFAANHGDGLVVIDASDPTDLQRVTALDLTDRTQDIHIVGDLLVAASWSQFQVVDISQPTQPELLADLPVQGTAYEVWAQTPDIAYVVDLTGKQLLTIDLTTPSDPQIIDRSPPGTLGFRAIDGAGQTLFVGGGLADQGMIRVYDITDPRHPVFVTEELAGSLPIYEIAFSNGLLYAASFTGVLHVFSAEPCAPADVDSGT